MNKAYNTNRRDKKYHLSENLKERYHLEERGVDGRIILQEVLGRTVRLLSLDTTRTE
jgi:hypothetical protein